MKFQTDRMSKKSTDSLLDPQSGMEFVIYFCYYSVRKPTSVKYVIVTVLFQSLSNESMNQQESGRWDIRMEVAPRDATSSREQQRETCCVPSSQDIAHRVEDLSWGWLSQDPFPTSFSTISWAVWMYLMAGGLHFLLTPERWMGSNVLSGCSGDWSHQWPKYHAGINYGNTAHSSRKEWTVWGDRQPIIYSVGTDSPL